jgi:hypothetical protein
MIPPYSIWSTGRFGEIRYPAGKYNVREQVGLAFKEGRLKRQPCLICADPWGKRIMPITPNPLKWFSYVIAITSYSIFD